MVDTKESSLGIVSYSPTLVNLKFKGASEFKATVFLSYPLANP